MPRTDQNYRGIAVARIPDLRANRKFKGWCHFPPFGGETNRKALRGQSFVGLAGDLGDLGFGLGAARGVL